MKSSTIKIGAILLFFFANNIGLPSALQYTTLLSPLLFFYTFGDFWKSYVVGVVIYLILFILHYMGGVTAWPEYFRSSALHFTVLIICVAFFKTLKKDPEILYKAFDNAVAINFVLTLLAVILLLSGNQSLMWDSATRSGAFANLPRLKMLTYEPSYYSTLMAPIFLYFFVRWTENTRGSNFFPLCLIVLSLCLSLSVGVIFALFFSIVISNILALKRRTIIIFSVSGIFLFLAVVFFVTFDPSSPLVLRIINILAGTDVSGNARLVDSWTIAVQILQKHHSYLTGVGWGQIKIVGHDIIGSFYNYSDNVDYNTHYSDSGPMQAPTYDIPNFTCELLATNGILGVAAYLIAQIYLYRATNVRRSIYRKYIFWFIFIYQFTGSYSTSVVHYALLVIAFYKPMDLYFVKYRLPHKSKKGYRLNYDLSTV